MPFNCKITSVAEAINFFEVEIDGMGKNDGFPRNEGVPDSIRLWRSAQLCELTQDEFLRLEIPDGSKMLLRDKNELNPYSAMQLEKLKQGKDFYPLIVRGRLPGDADNSSFYIEDGAHRAIALKFYFENNAYKPVKVYIGFR